MVDAQDAAIELLRRKSALASLESFGKYMQPGGEIDFKFAPAQHHLLLIDAIEGLMVRGEYDRLMIMMPPGGAKSTYTSIQASLWYLANNPEHNLLCASNTETLAENFNRRRRNNVLTPQWQALAGTSINPKEQGVSKFSNLQGGSITAAGVGSGIVGVRSNLNILDDPVLNWEQSLSNNQMQKQWDWYQADFRSRLIPTGKEIVITTRWCRRDIPGRILDLIKKGEEKGWRILRIPMEADSADDPLGRELGDRLWPEWFSPRQVEENKRDTQRWMGMYQQIPMDEEGAWVGPDNIVMVEELPDELTLVVGVDIALTVGGGDYTTFNVCGISAERDIYIIDVIRKQCDINETAETFFALTATYPDITMFYIDDDNASKALSGMMIEKCKAKNEMINLYQMPTGGRDKETRAAPLRGLFMQRRVKILRNSVWNNALIAELMDFPSGDHDDQVDGLSLVGRQFIKIPSPTAALSKKPAIEFFLQEKNGQTMTTRTLDELHDMGKNSGILSIAKRRI
jgi:predicted phage terminase large subunit-like protein